MMWNEHIPVSIVLEQRTLVYFLTSNIGDIRSISKPNGKSFVHKLAPLADPGGWSNAAMPPSASPRN